MTGPNPSGLCMCGCGQPAPIARWSVAAYGWVKDQPKRFIDGHHRRLNHPRWSVDPESGCWVWAAGMKSATGYGYITVQGVQHLAHRWMYEQLVGAIPVGMELDHLCRNRACVNPAHLEPVTTAENAHRRPSNKLQAADAAAIRNATGTQREIAERFGVSQSQVSRIRTGSRWAVAA